MRKTNIEEEDQMKTMMKEERKTLGESLSRSWSARGLRRSVRTEKEKSSFGVLQTPKGN